MNLDMWFRDDICNLLRASAQAAQFMSGEGQDFQRGYAASIAVMAHNFHLTADDLRIGVADATHDAARHITPSLSRRDRDLQEWS